MSNKQEKVDEIFGRLAGLLAKGAGAASSKLGNYSADQAAKQKEKQDARTAKSEFNTVRKTGQKLAKQPGGPTDDQAIDLHRDRKALARQRLAKKGITLKGAGATGQADKQTKGAFAAKAPGAFDRESMSYGPKQTVRSPRDQFLQQMRQRMAKRRLTMSSELPDLPAVSEMDSAGLAALRKRTKPAEKPYGGKDTTLGNPKSTEIEKKKVTGKVLKTKLKNLKTGTDPSTQADRDVDKKAKKAMKSAGSTSSFSNSDDGKDISFNSPGTGPGPLSLKATNAPSSRGGEIVKDKEDSAGTPTEWETQSRRKILKKGKRMVRKAAGKEAATIQKGKSPITNLAGEEGGKPSPNPEQNVKTGPGKEVLNLQPDVPVKRDSLKKTSPSDRKAARDSFVAGKDTNKLPKEVSPDPKHVRKAFNKNLKKRFSDKAKIPTKKLATHKNVDTRDKKDVKFNSGFPGGDPKPNTQKAPTPKKKREPVDGKDRPYAKPFERGSLSKEKSDAYQAMDDKYTKARRGKKWRKKFDKYTDTKSKPIEVGLRNKDTILKSKKLGNLRAKKF